MILLPLILACCIDSPDWQNPRIGKGKWMESALIGITDPQWDGIMAGAAQDLADQRAQDEAYRPVAPTEEEDILQKPDIVDARTVASPGEILRSADPEGNIVIWSKE